MRLLMLALFWTAALSGCARAPASLTSAPAAPSAHSVAEVQDPALRDTLLAMAEADQKARAPLTSAFGPGEPSDPKVIATIAARIAATDSANLAGLRRIVREHGWPSKRLVGSEGAGAVFLLVQHADRDVAFQKEYLAWLEHAFRAGDPSPQAGEALALLTDRVRTNEGRPQLYGTQVKIETGRVVVHTIEDEQNVDARRLELGLRPLAEYLEQLERFYGLPR